MRYVALFAIAAAVAGAQEFVVAPKKDLPIKRIHFVVDVSGSLRPSMGDVYAAVTKLVQPGDQFEMKLTVFSASAQTWESGWVECPGPEDLKKAQALIESTPHLDTYVLPALRPATQEKGPPTLVVLVTDGQFIYETDAAVIGCVAASKHPVLVYGVGDRQPILETLGKLGGGYIK